MSVAVVVMLTHVVTPQLQAPPPATQVATAEKPWPPAGVYVKSASGLTMPRLVREVKPRYTPAAKEAKITGIVTMEAVIQADGSVGEVRVTKSLDTIYGLDDEAAAALKKWVFSPGKKDGSAVPVMVEVDMTFSLR